MQNVKIVQFLLATVNYEKNLIFGGKKLKEEL